MGRHIHKAAIFLCSSDGACSRLKPLDYKDFANGATAGQARKKLICARCGPDLRPHFDGLGVGFGEEITASICGIEQNCALTGEFICPFADGYCQQPGLGVDGTAQVGRPGHFAQFEIVADRDGEVGQNIGVVDHGQCGQIGQEGNVPGRIGPGREQDLVGEENVGEAVGVESGGALGMDPGQAHAVGVD